MSVAPDKATNHIGVEWPTGKAVKPLPLEDREPKVQGGGERDPTWAVIFVEDSISVEVERKEGYARCTR